MFLNAVPFILDRMLNFPYFTTATNLFLTGDQTATNRGLPSRSLISAFQRTNRDDVKLEVDNPVKTLKFGDGTSKKKNGDFVCVVIRHPLSPQLPFYIHRYKRQSDAFPPSVEQKPTVPFRSGLVLSIFHSFSILSSAFIMFSPKPYRII